MPDRNVPTDWWKQACMELPASIACVSLDDKFVWANRAWSELVGYSTAELVNMRWQDLTHTEDIGGDSEALHAVKEGRQDQYYMEKRYVRKDGTLLPIGLYVSRFPKSIDRDIECFVVFAVNRKRDHQLDEMNTRIEILNEAIGRLQDRSDDQQEVVQGLTARDLFVDELFPAIKKHWTVITGFAAGFATAVYWIVWFIQNFKNE